MTEPATSRMWTVAMLLAIVGILLAGYATKTTVDIATIGLEEASGCSINDFVNCDVAHASSYATWGNVPVGFIGLLQYLFVAAILWLTRGDKRNDNGTTMLVVTWASILLAVLVSVFKAIDLVDLGVLCLVCVSMYTVNLALLITVGKLLGIRPNELLTVPIEVLKAIATGQRPHRLIPTSARPIALAGLALMALGYIGMDRYMSGASGEPVIATFDVDLENHFRQPARDITIPEGASVWGNPDADITLVEFADFQCPACQVSAFHLRGALLEFREDVRFVFLNYPLDSNINDRMPQQVHPSAGIAALSGVCAEQQGVFWEYHDLVFENQARLNPRLVVDLARETGLDDDAFQTCLRAPETLARVKEDLAIGFEVGVSGTPSLYVNGRKVRHWSSTRYIKAIIEEERRG